MKNFTFVRPYSPDYDDTNLNDNTNISMQNIFGTQNNAGSVDGKGFMERFTNLMFKDRIVAAFNDNDPTSTNNWDKRWEVTEKNTGSTFSFHAYVIKSK